MSDNVVAMPKPPQMVFICNCGCETHYVHPDFIECASCGNQTQDAGGGWALPESEVPDDLTRSAVRVGPPSLQKKRLAGRVMDDDCIGVALFFTDGRVSSAVTGVDTPERRAWWERRLADLRCHIGLAE